MTRQDELDAVVSALDSLAEHLADLAMDCLRSALSEDALEGEVFQVAGSQAELSQDRIDERRITRARRAIERAASLLRVYERDWQD